MCKKMKASSFIHSLTRGLESIVLYSHGLLNCCRAVHYCCCLILSKFCNQGSTGFEVRYRRSIDRASCCQSSVITSKCDRLDRTMLLLAFLHSWGVVFVSAMIWNSWLRSVASASTCPVSIIVYGERPFYFHLDRTERNKNITGFVSYCKQLDRQHRTTTITLRCIRQEL